MRAAEADTALAAANSLIEPVLTGATGHGRWDPDDGVWTSQGTRQIAELLSDTRAPRAAPRTPAPETSSGPQSSNAEPSRNYGPEL